MFISRESCKDVQYIEQAKNCISLEGMSPNISGLQMLMLYPHLLFNSFLQHLLQKILDITILKKVEYGLHLHYKHFVYPLLALLHFTSYIDFTLRIFVICVICDITSAHTLQHQ